MKERETVMDLVMEVVMMAMQDVKETLSVEVIIARSLVNITMTKMIAVRKHNFLISIQLYQYVVTNKAVSIQATNKSIEFVFNHFEHHPQNSGPFSLCPHVC